MTDAGIIVAAMGLLGTIAVALIGWLQHRGAKAAEVKTTSVQTVITELRAQLADHQKRIEELTKQVQELRGERDTLWRENRDLNDKVRDQTELIEDVMAYLTDRDAWETAGAVPPPPVHSWRIRAALTAHHAKQRPQED